METRNDREALLIELKRVLGAMVESGTASMAPGVQRAMQEALQSGRGRIGWLIETNPLNETNSLNADCLFMTGDKLVPLFFLRGHTDAVDAPAKSRN